MIIITNNNNNIKTLFCLGVSDGFVTQSLTKLLESIGYAATSPHRLLRSKLLLMSLLYWTSVVADGLRERDLDSMIRSADIRPSVHPQTM